MKRTSPPRKALARKATFEAALKLAGQTAKDFAIANETSKSHLSYVIRGERTSERLNAAIDTFIAKHLPQHAAVA